VKELRQHKITHCTL